MSLSILSCVRGEAYDSALRTQVGRESCCPRRSQNKDLAQPQEK
jgi:hypothetical protein